MPHLSPDQKQLICRECEGLSGADRTQKVQELAMQLNVHPSTVYRTLPRADRLQRTDRGHRKIGIARDILEKMMALSAKEWSAPEVIELAELNGWLAPQALSVPTYNRWLAAQGLSSQQRVRFIRPYRRFEEAHANERHYIDITGFEDYFVEPDGSVGYESTLSVSKNRAGNRKPRLQLFLMVDGHSRVAFALLYMGKNVLNWIDFMVRAWNPKEDPYRFPFQGRPTDLYSDSEGIFRSPLMGRYLGAMEVRYHHHFPGESRSKGKVERPIAFFQERLRHALRLELYERQKSVTLTRANQILSDIVHRKNTRIHTKTRQEPLARWRAGFAPGTSIRLMPDPSATDRFFYTLDRRVLQGDLTVQLLGHKWQLPRTEPFLSRTGQPIQIAYHPGQTTLKSIYVVIDDVEYEITHHTPVADVAGQYRTTAPSDMEKRLAQLDAVDLSKVQIDGIREAYTPKTFLPAPGEALDTDALALPRRAIERLALTVRLQEEGIIGAPPADWQRTYIHDLYRDGGQVFEDQYHQITEDLSGPKQAIA